jgi:hypothetical protein
MIDLPLIIPQPELPPHLPSSVKWLSGEGAGSWFLIDKRNNHYCIKRYSPNGKIECTGDFMPNIELDLNNDFQIGYPSHCSIVTTIQRGRNIIFTAITA